LAVSTLDHAKTKPNTTPARSPLTLSVLAQVEAIITYCQVVDPRSSAKYQLLRTMATSGHSPSEISADQTSPAFLSELKVMGAAFIKIPVSTGVSACKAGIAGL
jgi:hypothetical protein